MTCVSVIIPARNEEKLIGLCLESVKASADAASVECEMIVVLDRCTDNTERIAAEHGAKLVRHDAKNLAAIRNAGARKASGEVLVTVDADSRMSLNMIGAMVDALQSGKYIGGGVPLRPERINVPIFLTGMLIMGACLARGLSSAGAFWCYRRDFKAIGGFDETKTSAEDVDFGLRLKAHGRRQRKKYGTLWGTRLTTSCRKFDEFGDWFCLKLAFFRGRETRRAFKGQNQEFADKYWYDVKR